MRGVVLCARWKEKITTIESQINSLNWYKIYLYQNKKKQWIMGFFENYNNHSLWLN